LDVTVQFATSRRQVPSAQSLASWANAAYRQGQTRRKLRARSLDLTIRIVGALESRRLNRDWRGKDKPTNVLSFPAAPEGFSGTDEMPLGDLAICASVVGREAREQGKVARAHWAHMVVHGVLHLLGYDHEDDADAQKMEGEEVRILAQLGFEDPYLEDR
jgi:probable rRNA maturation factor